MSRWTRTLSLSLACALFSCALMFGAGSASAAAPVCENGLLLPAGTATYLSGDLFQGGDGDQCNPFTDGGPGAADAGVIDWHDVSGSNLNLLDNDTSTI